MKRVVVALLAIVLLLGLAGCGTKTEEYKGLTFEIPSNWTRNESKFGTYFSNPDANGKDGLIYIKVEGKEDLVSFDSASDAQRWYIEFITSEDEDAYNIEKKSVEVDGNPGTMLLYNRTSGQDNLEPAFFSTVYIVRNDKLYTLQFVTDERRTGYSNHVRFLKSLKIE